jgi:hypothetical protein
MLIRIPADRLDDHGADRPAGFLAAVRATATREGGHWLIDSVDWLRLVREHVLRGRRMPVLPHPTSAELADDYAAATDPWSKRGRRVVPAADYLARCRACEDCQWRTEFKGRHRCEHPQRSCARLVPWLRGEMCPLGNWLGGGLQRLEKVIATPTPRA